jgi:TPR repeat protein
LKLPMLSRAVVPAAVLLIMLVFLFSITRASHPSNAAVAPSETSTAAKLMTTTEPLRDLHQRSGPFPAFKLSHMQVTDPAMSSALRNLSRHEIVGLRRRAAYGDDSAAFLLGMAYETGHLVPQNCIQAREWVTESANEGNAAAQYNLGLRYRQGDGEPVNQEVGAQWLRKAAAQKYSQAQLALESVP